MKSFKRVVIYGFVLAACSFSASAQQSVVPERIPECRRFAQEFYSWYVPFTQRRLNGPASDVALRRKSAVFSPGLLKALRIDSEAQARAKGKIDGLDSDPFVGGQDPADHYAVRQVTTRGDRCFAEVWRDSRTDTSAKSQKPEVVAELAQRAGHWEFVNFYYPDVNADLMSILASLRKDRGKP